VNPPAPTLGQNMDQKEKGLVVKSLKWMDKLKHLWSEYGYFALGYWGVAYVVPLPLIYAGSVEPQRSCVAPRSEFVCNVVRT
jgi:hypothetical protein